MRLSTEQKELIHTTLIRHFGEGSLIRLFGSRLDDAAKGGDIDLYIEPAKQSIDEIVDGRLHALADLHLLLGDQKIDLVINRKAGRHLPIYDVACKTGELL